MGQEAFTGYVFINNGRAESLTVRRMLPGGDINEPCTRKGIHLNKLQAAFVVNGNAAGIKRILEAEQTKLDQNNRKKY